MNIWYQEFEIILNILNMIIKNIMNNRINASNQKVI
jgi:hypothetical protein